MISLIKNELTKIFHKKAIYVIAIIAIGFMILNIVLTKYFESNVQKYNSNDVEFYTDLLNGLDKSDPNYKEEYIAMKSQLETAILLQKYDYDSWQWQVISSNSDKYIYPMIELEGTENYEKAKNEYDSFVEKLNSGDWRTFVQAELDDVNEQIKTFEKQKLESNNPNIDLQLLDINVKKQALEWRLEKDIPYGDSNKNEILTRWEDSKKELEMLKEQEKTKPLTYEEKYSKQNVEETVYLSEYDLKNNLKENMYLNTDGDRWVLASDSDYSQINIFFNAQLFITIAIVVIAGTIVSEEFNKGTIKLLLVRPYKRIKILIAKFIACLIILILTYVVMALAQFIFGGIMNGFNDYVGKASIYNFKTSSVEEISTFKYMILSGLSILPQYLLIMTLAFSLSVLFINSPIAIALPLLGIMGAELINELAYHYEKAKFLRFFVTPNWDLSIYLFGKLPQFEPISLPFSIAVCVVYFAIMLVTSLYIFKRKEIKNI
ncbi:MAG: ABC transporter permease [Clostridia bacterium]|nr:ABC transporter permease [Clostridia bacterium]